MSDAAERVLEFLKFIADFGLAKGEVYVVLEEKPRQRVGWDGTWRRITTLSLGEDFDGAVNNIGFLKEPD